MERVDVVRKEELLDSYLSTGYEAKSISSMFINPSFRKDGEAQLSHGIEVFIDMMRGKDYLAVFIVTPLSKEDIAEKRMPHQFKDIIKVGDALNAGIQNRELQNAFDKIFGIKR